MILAILQARMSSSRMPGAAMSPVLGEPMIWRQIERIRRARTLDKLVVATSSASSDDALAGFLLGRGISVHRGAHFDLLECFSASAAAWSPTHAVRLTAECPLTDPQIVDQAVHLALETGADYVSNCVNPTYPVGLEVEVMTTEAVLAAAAAAHAPADREQVTPFIRRDPARFAQAHLTRYLDLSGLRWTVDRPEDFAFVRAVFQRFQGDIGFSLGDILELLDERPDLALLADRARPAPEAAEPAPVAVAA
jgi:spore coat polysaccharide biosynthesis protein SpsF